MRIHIVYETEQGEHRNIGVAFVEDRIRVAADRNAEAHAKARPFPYVHTHNIRVYIDCAHNVGAFFIQIPHRIPGHLPAAVLDGANFLIIHVFSLFR